MVRLAALSTAILFVSSVALAEVAEVAPAGFMVRHEVTIAAAPDKVYAALTGGIGSWWNSDHTYSHDSKNLSIDLRPGGCFCEKLPDGGGVEHMRVVYLSPGHTLRMTGALGPLQASGLSGSMTWRLVATQGSTTVDLSYSVGGYMQGGFEKIAPTVDAVLGEQLSRLKAFVETGKPSAK